MKNQQPNNRFQAKQPQNNSQYQKFLPSFPKQEVRVLIDSAIKNHFSTVEQSLKWVKQTTQGQAEYQKYRSSRMKSVIQKAAMNKTVSQFMQKHGVDRDTAVLSMLHDDFFSDLISRGRKGALSFWQGNKDTLRSLLFAAIKEFAPTLMGIGGTQDMKSSDPYSVDKSFVQSLFNRYDMQPAPRNLLDPLGFMRNVMQIPVTTGSAGTCIVTVCPQSMVFGPPAIAPGATYYPFASMSSSNTNLVYNGATLYNGPFQPQYANLTGWLPDQCKLSFQCTQSLLNASGRIYCGVFYQNPNTSFTLNNVFTYDPTLTTITPSGIENSTRAFRLMQVAGCVNEAQHAGRWIPNGDDFTADLYSPYDYGAGNVPAKSACWIILYFTGCTPSTTIGSVTVTTAISHKPVDTQAGIFDLKVRGEHPATDNWIHQLKHSGHNMQFATEQQVRPFFVHSFADLRLGGEGFCVDDSLKILGLQPFGRPWITIAQLQSKYPKLATYVYGDDSHVQKGRLVVDLAHKHAYVKGQQLVYSKTLFGRPIAIGSKVFVYEPYQQFQVDHSVAQGTLHEGKRYCSALRTWETYPPKVDKTFVGLVVRQAPYLYRDSQLKIGKALELYQSGRLTGVYEQLPYQTVAPFLDGVFFSIQTSRVYSRQEVDAMLLKGGIQPNPGPTHTHTTYQKAYQRRYKEMQLIMARLPDMHPSMKLSIASTIVGSVQQFLPLSQDQVSDTEQEPK